MKLRRVITFKLGHSNLKLAASLKLSMNHLSAKVPTTPFANLHISIVVLKISLLYA